MVLPLPNIAGSGAFLADPYAQYLALKRLRTGRRHLLAIYHSHPGGGAEPSESDVLWGSAWPCAHLIVALPAGGGGAAGRRGVRMRAWWFGPAVGECTEVPVLLDAPGGSGRNLS